MSCSSTNNNSDTNSKASCALCDALNSPGIKQDKTELLNGFKLALASAIVFLLPLFISILFAITQDTAIKKIIALLAGFGIGSLISMLLSKLLIKHTKVQNG